MNNGLFAGLLPGSTTGCGHEIIAHPAIDENVDAGDVAGPRANQKQNGICHIFGHAQLSQWNHGFAGRAAILAAFKARPPRVTRQVGSNVVIDVESADEARGESAMLLFTGAAEPLVGSFHDKFVRTVDGWRFAERRGSLLFT